MFGAVDLWKCIFRPDNCPNLERIYMRSGADNWGEVRNIRRHLQIGIICADGPQVPVLGCLGLIK